ncbi:MAG: hypothetical protein OXT69_07185 [Candidatus Poribacteria bacterium]|nr:hypothetical protein [Candidatus Poribacteria bacterium]
MMIRTLAVILLAAGICVLLAFGYAVLKSGSKPELEPEIIQTPKAQPPSPEPEPSAPVPEPEGEAEAKPSVEANESPDAPDAQLDSDQIAAAWKKVEHIRNNLHLYGIFHPEADAIIAQLMPPPDGFLNAKSGFTESGEFIHDEEASEQVIALFDQLIPLKDPRSAELLARYLYEYSSGGTSWSRALVDLGAPSVPFLLEHADDEVWGDSVAALLKRIVNRHPDLDSDIVTYILYPLFKKYKR